FLGEHGEEEHAREHAEPDQGDEGRPRREVAIGEDAEVEDGLASHELADDEAQEGGGGEHEQGDDEARVEPVLALAAVEEELEAAEAQDHEAETGPVDAAGLAQVWRIEEEGAGHEEAEEPHGQVDVEDPAPRPGVREVAAQGGSDDGSHHEADPPDGHGETALTEREDLPQDGLGERNDRAAPHALEDARHDQEGQVRRDAGEERAHGEERGADEEEALAPEKTGQPARGGGGAGGGPGDARGAPRELHEAQRTGSLTLT